MAVLSGVSGFVVSYYLFASMAIQNCPNEIHKRKVSKKCVLLLYFSNRVRVRSSSSLSLSTSSASDLLGWLRWVGCPKRRKAPQPTHEAKQPRALEQRQQPSAQQQRVDGGAEAAGPQKTNFDVPF